MPKTAPPLQPAGRRSRLPHVTAIGLCENGIAYFTRIIEVSPDWLSKLSQLLKLRGIIYGRQKLDYIQPY